MTLFTYIDNALKLNFYADPGHGWLDSKRGTILGV